jgi:hypothetical protein
MKEKIENLSTEEMFCKNLQKENKNGIDLFCVDVNRRVRWKHFEFPKTCSGGTAAPAPTIHTHSLFHQIMNLLDC